MKLKYSVQDAAELLNINTLRNHQIQPINDILNYKTSLIIYPTGSGKSAIFQIPALVYPSRLTLVVEPTISLMFDQVNKLKARGVSAEYISYHNRDKHDSIFRKMRNKELTFLYVSPERLENSFFREAVQSSGLWLLVVDEAHCILNWSTFRSGYRIIEKFLTGFPAKKRPVVAAFTATAPDIYRQEICRQLTIPKQNIHVQSLNRSNITLLKENCTLLDFKKRLTRVNYNIKKYGKAGSVVVYCATKKNVDVVYNYLSDRFPGEVAKCHSYMDQRKREKKELQFIQNKKRIMVATTAFGMGVDKGDIRLVIHFNMPLSVIDYYQQIGRAGRDGNASHAVLLYHPDDIGINEAILKQGSDAIPKKWQEMQLKEMAEVMQSNQCLMQQVLAYLGEDKPVTCNHCTNCQRKRRNAT